MGESVTPSQENANSQLSNEEAALNSFNHAMQMSQE